MSLSDQIRMSQISAAEDAVTAHLKELGLITEPESAMSQDNPNGQTQYLVDGELVAMSQDKPVAFESCQTCRGTWDSASGRTACGACDGSGVQKPVAAQEPIFWACYAKEKLVAVMNDTEYVHTFKCNFPLTHRIVPLYDHAAPCADPIAWRNIASPNGIRRFMTQKQYDANPNLQKYYEPFTCARCAELESQIRKDALDSLSAEGQADEQLEELQAKITEQAEELRIVQANLAQLEKDFDRRNEVVDAQAERIKALEALSMQSNQDHLNARKDYQTKLAKADAVILKCKEAMTWDIGGEPLPTLEIAALAAIEQYQKGE